MTPEEQYKILDMMKVYAAWCVERELAAEYGNKELIHSYADKAEAQYHETWDYLDNIVNRNK